MTSHPDQPPLRIIQIVEKLEIGGLERLTVDLALAQKHAGHQPLILTVSHAGALADEARAAGIPVLSLHKGPGSRWKTVRAMAGHFRFWRPDVVHTHNSVIHHYAVLAGLWARVPVIVNTRHGLGTLHTGSRQEWYYRRTMPFTHAVVFVCEYTRRFFTQRGVPAAKSHVIYNAIPLEKFTAHQASPGAARPRIRFGTVGRMVPAKAHSVLVEAFALLTKHLRGAELYLIGDGPLRPQITEQIRALSLQDRVLLLGASREVPELLSGWDVFVLPSISEGLPVAVLEAMACGLPLVSTRVGGVPEVAPENEVAWFCPPGDPLALAEAMRQAALSPRLAAMGAAARRIARDRFGIESMLARYVQLFRRLLDTRRSPTARSCVAAP